MPTQGQASPDSPDTVDNETSSAPVQSSGGRGDKCLFCQGREFKRSRLHMTDALTLLRLRVPARCVRCGQLQTISLGTAQTAQPAGKRSGPTHQVVIPQPVAQVQPVRVPAPVVRPVEPSRVVQAVDEALVPDPGSRDAIPHAELMDVLDIRCQYCPAQSFRRSRLRLQDLFSILVMRYSVRCLRCGQRQTVNFMVAATGVPSSYKQARNMRNTETWGEFTASSVDPVARIGPVKPLSAVVGEIYTLKDIPVGTDTPLTSIVSQVYAAKSREMKVESETAVPAPEPRKAVKKPVDDQTIW
jgi:hypothetical protein